MKNRIQKMNLKITMRLALMMLTVLLGMGAARAATLTVTNTDDSGAGSLRQAIADAASGDTIDFAVSGTITLASELVIDKNLNIVGPGANQLTISGNNLVRVFFINPGASGATTGPPATVLAVSISNLTIADGRAKGGDGGFGEGGIGGGGAAGMGGGVFVNNGALTVSGVVFNNNQAIGGNGGSTSIFGGNGGSGGGGGVGSNGSTATIRFGGHGGSLGGSSTSPGNPGGEGSGGGGGNSIGFGGSGGFGGGGGGGLSGGNGGFGGGGGGAPGVGGMFGGSGVFRNGGGGAGLGGGIFVRAGSLNISNAAFDGSRAIGGTGGTGANSGQGKGAGIFLLDGVTAVSSNVSFDRSEAGTFAACTPTEDPDVFGNLTGYALVPRGESLTFTQQPTETLINTTITPAVRVQVLDQCRQPFSNANTISIAIGNNPGGATLGGTTSRIAAGGLVIFDDLSLDAFGEGYTLTATDPLLRVPSVTSQPFDVGTLNPVVTNTNDSGTGSLRQAILDASAGSTITFAPGLAGATISLSTAGDGVQGPSALLIRRNLTIDGAPGGITIARDTTNPNLSLRLFFVRTGATLRLRNLTLSDGFARAGDGINGGTTSFGSAAGGGGAGFGGAIYNAGALILENTTLANNRAVGGNGGNGVSFAKFGAGGFPNGGNQNQAGGFGGGGGGNVSSRLGSQFGGGFGGTAGGFRGTGVGGGGGAGLGGAVFNDNGTATIVNSTFSGNTAQGGNGGNNTGVGTAGDGGAGFGGGLFSLNNSVTVTNSTFANNPVAGGGGGNAAIPGAAGPAQGGGIYVLGFGNTATLTMNNSIVALTPNGVSDFFTSVAGGGTVNTGGTVNIIQTDAGFGGSFTAADPLLGALADNGGATRTHALLAGSPAINTGNNALAVDADNNPLTTDQRGTGFPRIVGGTVDIGAFEFDPCFNNVPVANNDGYATNEDTALNVAAPGVLGNDTGNGTLTATLVAAPTNAASFTLNANGSFSYTPAANFNGADSFTYKVSANGVCESNTATVTITVNSVNDNPDAINDAATVAEDSGANIINVLANDTDGDSTTLTVSSVTNGANGAVAITNGGTNVSYTPAANFNGSDSFTYTISDGNGGSDTATVSVNVTPVNDAPTITAAVGVTRQQAAGVSNSSIAAVNDIEDTETTLSVTVNNSTSATVNGVTVSGIAVNAAGNVTANVSAACGATTAGFTLKVTDGGNLSATAVLNVTVTNETTPPIINPISNVVATLPPNSTATSVAVSFPLPTATDNCSTPTVTTNPVSGTIFNVGTTTVNVTAADALGNMATGSFTVTVLYNFAGFFQPVDNLPIVNVATAGSSIPVKFSLSGNKGLAIFAPGYPASSPVECDATEPGDTIEETVNAGGSSLTYNATNDQYSYVWKTERAWRGTCRILVVRLNDGTEHFAKFRFR